MLKLKDKNNWFQYDINQVLVGSSAAYIDYMIDGEVFRVRNEAEGCRVPDEFFQKAGGAVLFEAYADGTYTKNYVTIEGRAMPPDYEFTPTERETFGSLVAYVNAEVAEMERRAASGEFNGKDGRDGINGKDGRDGEPGPRGPQGLPGETGPRGLQGPAGPTGEPGPAGRDGSNGRDGKDGAPGAPGISPSAKVERIDGGALVTITDAAGTTTAELHDGKDGAGGGSVTDVQIAGTSILSGGVANVALDSPMRYQNNKLGLTPSVESNIDGRASSRALFPNKIDYAVKCAMCDGKGAAWTADEQKAAQLRLGILSTEGVKF